MVDRLSRRMGGQRLSVRLDDTASTTTTWKGRSDSGGDRPPYRRNLHLHFGSVRRVRACASHFRGAARREHVLAAGDRSGCVRGLVDNHGRDGVAVAPRLASAPSPSSVTPQLNRVLSVPAAAATRLDDSVFLGPIADDGAVSRGERVESSLHVDATAAGVCPRQSGEPAR
jgi:hypothetical protein